PKNDAAKFRAGSTRWNSSLAQPLAQTLVCAVAHSLNALAQNKGIRQRLGRHQHITSAMALHSQASRIRSLLVRGFAQMACQGNLAIQMAPPLTLRSSLFMARCGRTFRGQSAPLQARPRVSSLPWKATSPWRNVVFNGGAKEESPHVVCGANDVKRRSRANISKIL